LQKRLPLQKLRFNNLRASILSEFVHTGANP